MPVRDWDTLCSSGAGTAEPTLTVVVVVIGLGGLGFLAASAGRVPAGHSARATPATTASASFNRRGPPSAVMPSASAAGRTS